MEKEIDKKTLKDLDMKGFWSRLWDLLAPSHKQIIKLVGLVNVFELSRFVGPYILKIIIDLITSFKEEDITKIIVLTLVMFCSNQLVAIIDYFVNRSIVKILADVEAYIPVSAYRKMLNLSLTYHERENTGIKVSKVIRGSEKIINFLGSVFWDVAPTILQILLTTVILFAVDWRFGAVFLIFVPIFVVITLRLNSKVFPLRKFRHEAHDDSSGLMTQAIININTVKSFVQEKREESRYEKIRNDIKENTQKEFEFIIKYNLGRYLIIDLGRVSILFFGIFLVWKGQISIGSLVFIYTITEKALLALFRISRLYDRIMESSEAIDRLYQISQEKVDIKSPEKVIKLKKIVGQIEFKDVNFIYRESKAKALDNVNLKINSGCFTALVGPSGGGKTTAVRMIYRHYDPTEGQILIDGVDVRKYDLDEFRKNIAIVPQEVEIFNASVKDNIAYANSDASLKEVKAAAKIANADEFINKLSSGYETLVGERGIKLSGGQRQRVGIARSILANPKIIIFDEATSNLDSQSECLIQEALDRIARGRTIIVIAHRLSTIRKADKIIVLENGKVVEEGSHYELSKTDGGLYAKLLNLQSMGDISQE